MQLLHVEIFHIYDVPNKLADESIQTRISEDYLSSCPEVVKVFKRSSW